MWRAFAVALMLAFGAPMTLAAVPSPTIEVDESSDAVPQTSREWLARIWDEPLGPINLALVFLSTTIAGVGLYLGWRAHRTSHQQLRAYVLIDASRLEVRRPEPDANLIQVAMRLKNFGQTPAFEVSLASNGQFAEVELGPPNFDGMTPVDQRNSKIMLGPGGEIEFPPFATKLSDDQARALSRNRAWVYAWVIVNYKDAFGQSRRTTAFVRTEGEADGRWPVVPCKAGNDAS